MSLHSEIHRLVAPRLARHGTLKQWALATDRGVEGLRHSLAISVPALTPAAPRQMTVAVTAHCNLRCKGCRYGRDFMPGHQLPLQTALDMLDDARDAGIELVRLYGGEPLLHKELAPMVKHAIALGLSTYITSNGILLERKFDALYEAGLRNITIGVYGTDDDYDAYVQRDGSFARVKASLSAVRRTYGSKVSLRMNWLLTRQSCSVRALHEAFGFAQDHDMPMQVDLVHYSLPYFTEGTDRELQFRPEDKENIAVVVAEMLRLRDLHPRMFEQSPVALNSISDWLLKGPDMRVPCDKYRMVWVGADGTVQLCYAAFPLGNLHQSRLKDMLSTPTHRAAVRGAVTLQCPNCHCGYDTRVQKHGPSRRKYAVPPA